MFFSKSFGYALRGILYIAIKEEAKRIQLDEISEQLNIPRHFLGKVMKKLVKNKILSSTKGPYGGFSLLHDTLDTPLIKILELTDGMTQFESCVLCLRNCNSHNPCPLHDSMMNIRTEMKQYMTDMKVEELIKGNKPGFIKSITTR